MRVGWPAARPVRAVRRNATTSASIATADQLRTRSATPRSSRISPRTCGFVTACIRASRCPNRSTPTPAENARKAPSSRQAPATTSATTVHTSCPTPFTPNDEVEILFVDDVASGVQVPSAVDLEVTETQPGLKGDTASGGGSKPATLETGVTIEVPLFIEEGEKVRVDTRTGAYVSRS